MINLSFIMINKIILQYLEQISWFIKKYHKENRICWQDIDANVDIEGNVKLSSIDVFGVTYPLTPTRIIRFLHQGALV